MGRLGDLMLIIGGLITILTFIIFIEETIRLFRKWPLRSYCTTVGTLAVFPVINFKYLLK
jgi:uncharacterized membrane protein